MDLENQRPREKLARYGAKSLTCQELLAILLGTGTKGRDVMAVAQETVGTLDALSIIESQDVLSNIAGIGPAKAALIIAAYEFSRRRLHTSNTKIRSPQDVVQLLGHLVDRKQEHLVCITLNGAHEVIRSRTVTIGTANSTIAHPREIYSCAIKDHACAIIVAHNHPSGNCEPSQEDHQATRRIREAGEVLGIKLLDHIIFARSGHFSFKESGFV
jgi:DNA repair protein RadC